MDVQNPGTVSQADDRPAAAAPATAPCSMASCQCSTARWRPATALRANATSPAAKTSSAELRMCWSTTIRDPADPAVANPAAFATSVRGATPVAATTTSPPTVVPSPSRTPSGVTSTTSTPPRYLAPERVTNSRSRLPASTPSRFCCGNSSGATSVVVSPRPARDAATSHPMNPAPTTTADVAPAAASRSRRASANERSDSARRPPGTGSPLGVAPHASTSAPYGMGSSGSPWSTTAWSEVEMDSTVPRCISMSRSVNHARGCSDTSVVSPRRKSLLSGGRS